MDERDREESAFRSHHVLYQFVRMLLGLKNAPTVFQRALNVILFSLIWPSALVYLEDIVVFWKTVEQHLNRFQ